MNAEPESKVTAIFNEMAGSRAEQIDRPVPDAAEHIRVALTQQFGEEAARDIALHLTDWASDAAFVVAMLLYPERFSQPEISAGVEDFLIHAPNHIAAAAKLHGFPVADIFDVGACDEAASLCEKANGPCDFSNANMAGVVFDNVNLQGGRFNNINLGEAQFSDVNLSGAAFENVALAGVTIRNANCSNLTLTNARLDGMTIDGVLVSDLFAAYRARHGAK